MKQKIIFPSSQSKDLAITLNIENFEPSQASKKISAITHDRQALEAATKELFKKISESSTPEEEIEDATVPTQETTKQIFEKIAATQSKEKISLKATTEEEMAKAKLAKLEQKRLDIQKKEQEALAKKEALEKKKEYVKKIEQERLNALAITAAKAKARLAKIEQKRLKKEKKKQDALAKAKKIEKRKQAKSKKQKLAKKAKARKAKLRKQKQAKKRRVERAKKKRKQQQARKKYADPLANAIMSSGTPFSPRRPKKSAMRMIKKFYGSEFNSFTKTQKKFIEKNLGSIYRITQRTLTRNGYPYVAQKTHQQGTAIVTFYLHPNGKITGLRLKKRIGYASLDRNTIKVIRIAYKDYPRPKTKTKITFYVEYSLY